MVERQANEGLIRICRLPFHAGVLYTWGTAVGIPKNPSQSFVSFGKRKFDRHLCRERSSEGSCQLRPLIKNFQVLIQEHGLSGLPTHLQSSAVGLFPLLPADDAR